MDRSNVFRRISLFLAFAGYVFLLIALASFSPSDWPSHTVYPYPKTANLCGSAGALVAYYAFWLLGQGVFPMLFFSGVLLVIMMIQGKVSDFYLRAVGSILLTVAFAATIHSLMPSSAAGFPEGQGGLLGISASSYLQTHFNVVGTRLILLTAMLVGLLLAADDLVLRAPSVARSTMASIKSNTAGFKMPSMPSLPAMPSMPKWPAKAAAAIAATAAKANTKRVDDDDEDETPVMFKRDKSVAAIDEEIDLSYDDDAAVEHTFIGADDPAPSAAAEIPAPAPAADPSSTASAGPAFVETTTPNVEQKPLEIRKDIIVNLPSMLKPRQVSPPPPPPRELGEYHLPNWEILAEPEHGYTESQESFVREQAAILEHALKEFNIDAQVVEIDTGPVITMYEISLAPGIKVSAITALSNDIQRSLKAETVRIVAPVPGKNTVGIEVPNAQKEKVRLKELMQLAPDAMSKMAIPLFLGKDASGEPLIADMAGMPHCLIAGTTGSGKSVCINTIIMSIMYLQRPDQVKLILVDPKVVEMAPFKDIPHLMCPVINDSAKATSVLEWACTKMDERYEFLAEAGVRNIKGYNTLTQEELIERFQPGTPEEEAKIPKKLPYIVIIIDELADLMMTSGKEVESFIVRLAQKSRAVGIHLILATQRPQANVVTGLIKSNMPSRIAFRVASKMDSRIVLDQNGADLLLGQGDMLFMPPGASKPIRSQGTYIDDKEIKESVKLVKGLADAQYEPELVQIKATLGENGDMEKDELFDDAVRVVLETKRGSVSLLQRRLTIGYSRASRLIEQMAATGIVGEYKGSQAREAMLTLEEYEAMRAQAQADADDGMSV